MMHGCTNVNYTTSALRNSSINIIHRTWKTFSNTYYLWGCWHAANSGANGQ